MAAFRHAYGCACMRRLTGIREIKMAMMIMTIIMIIIINY
jgi:hypothetical protein